MLSFCADGGSLPGHQPVGRPVLARQPALLSSQPPARCSPRLLAALLPALSLPLRLLLPSVAACLSRFPRPLCCCSASSLLWFPLLPSEVTFTLPLCTNYSLSVNVTTAVFITEGKNVDDQCRGAVQSSSLGATDCSSREGGARITACPPPRHTLAAAGRRLRTGPTAAPPGWHHR